jgi:hypothetical protein
MARSQFSRRQRGRGPWHLLIFLAAAVAVGLALGVARSREPRSQQVGPGPGAQSAAQAPDADPAAGPDAAQAHAAILADDLFPSAKKCQKCHPVHYREWSASPHAYAVLSPVSNAMASKQIQGTNGTLGDFCHRCHDPVGMALNESVSLSAMDRHPASREGVTCVVCHRINQRWGKVSGRQALVSGDLHQPVYGPRDHSVLQAVLSQPDTYGKLNPRGEPGAKGRPIHQDAIPFFQLTTPAFCGSCHDVVAPSGFRQQDLFSEYKNSPAARRNQTCQDCHMGIVPGVPSGYALEPAARVNGQDTPPRKRTSHRFVGPDYSILHPGLFPLHSRAIREDEEELGKSNPGLATMREWLRFDYRAGWGTPEFEEHVPPGYVLPAPWADAAAREEARVILAEQFKLLAEMTQERLQLLATGYQLGDIVTERAYGRGIRFKVQVANGTDGHSVPSGFDAFRPVFLQVTVWDRDGRILYQSGDLDPNGDLRDDQSLYVKNGELPRDVDLCNLQSRFLVRNLRGGEREQVLPTPFSLDPLPYTRPETMPFTVLGRPFAMRKHKQNLEIGGSRWASYEVPASRLSGRPPYHAEVKLVAAMIPVNLVQAIGKVGFDYGMSPRQVADQVIAGHLVLHERYADFGLNGDTRP